MGQEQSKIEQPLKPSQTLPSSTVTSARKTVSAKSKKITSIECDGMLKLRRTPFKNSIEIQTQTQVLFLQHVETTLKQLLESRLNTNKLFLGEDIEKLIEEVTYTLAELKQRNVIYKDITAQYIYYDNGNFKLLPNELVEMTTYEKLKHQNQVSPSPQLIIALRCGEEEIEDDDILQKRMTILQVATLLPSIDCYDPQNYDILDSVVIERIALVEEYYGDKISRIIANMLDYDYTERMGFKELSIWVNRQLQPSRIIENQNDNVIVHSIMGSKVEKQQQIKTSHSQTSSIFGNQRQRGKLTKNNSVYMGVNRQNEGSREDRNKIYIHQGNHYQQQPKQISHEEVSSFARRKKQIGNEHIPRNYEKQMHLNNQAFNQSDSFKINQYVKQELRQPNPYCQEFKFPSKKEQQPEKHVERQTVKRVSKENNYQYRNNYQQESRFAQKQSQPSPFEIKKQEKMPLKQVGNQYYPNIQDILKLKPAQPNIDIKGPIGQNGALSRIKEQIMKSRKLIEQFKRSQGIKF